MSEWTPGPWAIRTQAPARPNSTMIHGANSMWVADVGDITDPKTRADARLIAVAPEMAEALLRLATVEPDVTGAWWETVNAHEEACCFLCGVECGYEEPPWQHEPDCLALTIDALVARIRGEAE